MPRDPNGLTLRQRAFVAALTNPESPTFLKPSASYRVANPHCALSTSWINSFRTLRLTKVINAMSKQWNVEQMGNRLKRYVKQLEVAGDIPQARDTIMDYARLTGQVVDRSEVKQITDADRSAIRHMVQQAMQNPQNMQEHSPTLTESTLCDISSSTNPASSPQAPAPVPNDDSPASTS